MPKLTVVERNQLIDTLTDGFNLTELKTLAARLGIDEDSLDSSSKDNLIIGFLTYLERRQQIPELVALGKKRRPELEWLNIAPPSAPTPAEPSIKPPPPEPITATQPSIFISYSQKDDEWKEKFLMHLGGFSQVATWSDQESLGVGEDWYSSLVSAIEAANIAVLLISPHFLTSQFVLKEEIPRFLERRQQGKLLMFPVICEPCVWQRIDWLNQMQVRPKRGQPLSSLNKKELENALVEIAMEIYDKVPQ